MSRNATDEEILKAKLPKEHLTSPMLNKGGVQFTVRKYKLKVSPHPPQAVQSISAKRVADFHRQGKAKLTVRIGYSGEVFLDR